jgi:hypothetical protein
MLYPFGLGSNPAGLAIMCLFATAGLAGSLITYVFTSAGSAGRTIMNPQDLQSYVFSQLRDLRDLHYVCFHERGIRGMCNHMRFHNCGTTPRLEL